MRMPEYFQNRSATERFPCCGAMATPPRPPLTVSSPAAGEPSTSLRRARVGVRGFLTAQFLAIMDDGEAMCGLRRKHFLQDRENGGQGSRGDSAEPSDEALVIDRAQLVECDEPCTAAEMTPHTPRISLSSRGHWRDDHRPQMLIELVGRHDHTRSGFADFTASGGIEFDQVHIAACRPRMLYRHFHSSLSNRVGVAESRRRSSPRSRMRRADSAQPARGLAVFEMRIRPGSAWSSTSSPSWASSSRVFGRRIPLELPIRTMCAFICISSQRDIVITSRTGSKSGDQLTSIPHQPAVQSIGHDSPPIGSSPPAGKPSPSLPSTGLGA